ncbi:MAG: cell division protein FtsA [Spirochaetales bacterium]|nr:cell division protein FtsA [Spirochaetales bacterium]
MFEGGLYVGLDIGATKVCTAIGEYDTRGNLRIAGVGVLPVGGTRKGTIVNIDSTGAAVLECIEKTEQEAGRTVEDLYVSVPAANLEGINSRGVVAVSAKNKEVSRLDVERVLDVARAIVVPMDREIIHSLPQYYSIDNQEGISDPLNMIGVRLGAEVHVITAPIATTQNIISCVNRSGYMLNEVVMDTWASSFAVLSQDERENGVLYIDMGGDTTDWIIIKGGAPWLSGSLPVGGNLVTNDISCVLKTPVEAAENIKREVGCCYHSMIDRDEGVIVPGVANLPPQTIFVREICDILEARMREIFSLIRKESELNRFLPRLRGGAVISGGGALLNGTAELASAILDLPVRIGYPQGPGDLKQEYRNPAYATALGLVQYGHYFGRSRGEKIPEKVGARTRPVQGLVDWFREFF